MQTNAPYLVEPHPNAPPGTRNINVIPGLAYFAAATDILGNHQGATGLPYVHACLLASLYYSQLGRVLQSHACVNQAGYALTIMLRPQLPRYKQMLEDTGDEVRRTQVKWLPDDNRTLFTFWTCLQLESDIVAELEVPQSGILSLESIMPWPNLIMAEKNNEISAKASWCYSMQLVYRRKLNIIHRDLYGPGKEHEYQLAEMNKLPKFPYINAMIEELKKVMDTNPNLVWGEDDPPSSDILEARLRAKMYGAEVITTRHFLRMVLNSQYDGGKNIAISPPIMEFARQCIRAMFHSAQAFWGIKGGRLVVTNAWGTSHAQWGHLIVLHAAYRDPRLRPYVPARELMELTARVRQFLVSVAHPSSALADDIRILDYATEGSGLREDLAELSRRGSRGGSRGGSGGGAGSSFGSEMGTHIRVSTFKFGCFLVLTVTNATTAIRMTRMIVKGAKMKYAGFPLRLSGTNLGDQMTRAPSRRAGRESAFCQLPVGAVGFGLFRAKPEFFLFYLPPIPSVKTTADRITFEGVEMLTFRNEKQRLHYLRCTSSGPIILQDPRNGNISGTSTSDLESLEKEMERLRLQAQVTPKATATTMAHRRFVIFPAYRSCY
ncbi:hypothetical protein V501_02491 [Pseudogymnoascus sp. VKM F-4519 (FW-2642)]|nr:hypothetical protein V501_02491 [Pseudogymnoascus sp. VKM F-4519 (FW-2642)]